MVRQARARPPIQILESGGTRQVPLSAQRRLTGPEIQHPVKRGQPASALEPALLGGLPGKQG
jgi:hypothetical protein